MALISLNPSPIIEQMRAWFFAKDRSIVLADDTFIEGEDISTPPTPIINRGRLYWKNKCWRQIDEDGNESSLCNGTIQDWTPTVVQGGAVVVTVDYARYKVDGEGILFITTHLTVSDASAAVAGSAILVESFPNVPTYTNNDMVIGAGLVTNGTTRYASVLTAALSTAFAFRTDGNTNAVGNTPSFALVNGDEISFTAAYEIA